MLHKIHLLWTPEKGPTRLCSQLPVTIKIHQVNLRDSPGKVAVTCRELQYHSNSHKNNLRFEKCFFCKNHQIFQNFCDFGGNFGLQQKGKKN